MLCPHCIAMIVVSFLAAVPIIGFLFKWIRQKLVTRKKGVFAGKTIGDIKPFITDKDAVKKLVEQVDSGRPFQMLHPLPPFPRLDVPTQSDLIEVVDEEIQSAVKVIGFTPTTYKISQEDFKKVNKELLDYHMPIDNLLEDYWWQPTTPWEKVKDRWEMWKFRCHIKCSLNKVKKEGR